MKMKATIKDNSPCVLGDLYTDFLKFDSVKQAVEFLSDNSHAINYSRVLCSIRERGYAKVTDFYLRTSKVINYEL